MEGYSVIIYIILILWIYFSFIATIITSDNIFAMNCEKPVLQVCKNWLSDKNTFGKIYVCITIGILAIFFIPGILCVGIILAITDLFKFIYKLGIKKEE